MALREIVLLTQIAFGSPDCCEISQTREAYVPVKEIPSKEINYVNPNTYAIKEEDLVYLSPKEIYPTEPLFPKNSMKEIKNMGFLQKVYFMINKHHNPLGRNEPKTEFVNKKKVPKENLKHIPKIKKKSPLKMWENRNRVKLSNGGYN